MKFAQVQPQTQPPTEPGLPPYYLWKDLGIIGFVVMSLAIALGKWLPAHLDERWKVRRAEIEAAISQKQKAIEAEASRDEHDRKLMADFTNTLLAKELQRSEELLENLAETQGNISLSLEVQSKQFLAIAEGFKTSTENQTKQIELLGEIRTLLQNTKS
jgi:hypothetical protein